MMKALTKRLGLNNQRGFTLIEVLVVIVILGLLAAILIPNVISWIDRSDEQLDIIEEHIGDDLNQIEGYFDNDGE
ncbi:prepilin-type N-terminal cleavage/methylation domain-containing protein [Alkalihalobacillus sp. MEB130]|uniref:type II secretion system protein n=1 Tax=Alkalihalobacillus sp. MEB130 TaxID=2976704 RepID=UPI0028DFECFD|nr:prepilin-type N-terminal cleavage/methylation domain-containing protein [Alkalihalobacillus sp. MEB130]MDT8859509.1 prepilin-type N-terminal cleavage/methylation domain-containing protein [Alkalihalobacillus sp. MEB130]